MTGYTPPVIGSTAWGGPLNDIIEEIDVDMQERPVDSDVVHTTGDESIEGVKTFSDGIVVPDASIPVSAVDGLDDVISEIGSGVTSVNGSTGVVTLDAAGVGAIPTTATLDDITAGSTNIHFTTAHQATLNDAVSEAALPGLAVPAVASALVEGAGIDISYAGGSITITATGGGGGGGYTRDTETYTTASLATDATETGTIAFGQAYTVYRIEVDKPARVRLYATEAQRDADEARPFGDIPTGNHGLVLDVLIDEDFFLDSPILDITPTVSGANLDVGNVPITVTNLDVSTGTVQVDITYLRTE